MISLQSTKKQQNVERLERTLYLLKGHGLIHCKAGVHVTERGQVPSNPNMEWHRCLVCDYAKKVKRDKNLNGL